MTVCLKRSHLQPMLACDEMGKKLYLFNPLFLYFNINIVILYCYYSRGVTITSRNLNLPRSKKGTFLKMTNKHPWSISFTSICQRAKTKQTYPRVHIIQRQFDGPTRVLYCDIADNGESKYGSAVPGLRNFIALWWST